MRREGQTTLNILPMLKAPGRQDALTNTDPKSIMNTLCCSSMLIQRNNGPNPSWQESPQLLAFQSQAACGCTAHIFRKPRRYLCETTRPCLEISLLEQFGARQCSQREQSLQSRLPTTPAMSGQSTLAWGPVSVQLPSAIQTGTTSKASFPCQHPRSF